jgi:hypothetical protein
MASLKFDTSKVNPPKFYKYASHGMEGGLLIIRYVLSREKDGYAKYMYEIFSEQKKLKTYKSEAAVTNFLNKRDRQNEQS